MKAPKYLQSTGFLFGMVVFVTVFSIVFLSLYQPFSSSFWLSFYPLNVFQASLAFYTLSVGFLLVSKLLMQRIQRHKPLTMETQVLWMLGELVVISGIYTAFTFPLGYGSAPFTFHYVLNIFLCVGAILIIPFTLAVLYADNKEKKEEIRLLTLKRTLDLRMPDVKLVNLYDYAGILRISAAQDDIYYVESQDNYVNICYKVDDKVTRYLLRCSTQEVEKALGDTTIIRCHRSYMVNIKQIKFLRHSRGRATITLTDRSRTEIPVSRSYYKNLLEYVMPEKIHRQNPSGLKNLF